MTGSLMQAGIRFQIRLTTPETRFQMSAITEPIQRTNSNSGSRNAFNRSSAGLTQATNARTFSVAHSSSCLNLAISHSTAPRTKLTIDPAS